MPEEQCAETDPDRFAARQHGQHDGNKAAAVDHERHKQTGADIGHVGAADTG